MVLEFKKGNIFAMQKLYLLLFIAKWEIGMNNSDMIV